MKYFMKKFSIIFTFCLILSVFVSSVNAAPAQCAYPADYDVIVTAPDGGVNLRAGAGTEYDILYSMIPNNTILHISADGQSSTDKWWGATSYNGINGWISLSQVTVLESQIIEEEFIYEEAYSNYGYSVSYDVIVSAPDGGVNIRSGPGVEYYKVLSDMIPNNIILHVNKEAQASNGNYWGHTTYNGTSGWIALTQVSVMETQTLFDEIVIEDVILDSVVMADPVNVLYTPEPLEMPVDLPDSAAVLFELAVSSDETNASIEETLDTIAEQLASIDSEILTNSIFNASINAMEEYNYSGCYNLCKLYKKLFPQGEYTDLFNTVEVYTNQLKNAAASGDQDQTISNHHYTVRYILLSRENTLPFNGDYVFPASNKRILSWMDLDHEDMTNAKLLDGIKEIYARHGKRFLDSGYQTYFDQKDWYEGTIEPEDFSYTMLSYVELKNIGILLGQFHQNINLVEEEDGYSIPNRLYVVNCNESITLRGAPDVNAVEICQIPLNDTVFFIESSSNGFMKVYYQGIGGYCLASYLSSTI